MKFSLKRLIDIVGAGLGLLCLSPLLLVVAGLVWWKLGSPIIYRHQRPGLHGKPFGLIKFRTMIPPSGEHEVGDILRDRERVTALGWFLRQTSLDELPELYNVLKGDMSLVGPRPLLMQYLDRYTPEQRRRHETKPGITGWAQVNGRNDLPWEERFALDLWYVENQSMC
ncbi:MAG: sugar transferase, partial [Nitrospira sp.]